LNRRFNSEGRDEVARVSGMLNHLVTKLHQMIAEISGTAQEVADASHQLERVADEIATGSEEVAAQTATVATASEEMSATSGEIAYSCQRAAEGARRASDTAGDGAAVVERTVKAMEHIAAKVRQSADVVQSLGARSDEINGIVETIEDIADQTNLLALNASIEAARAGEQGRGFAVVADEVRALAERTSRATKEIGQMIKGIQRETKGAVVVMEEGVAEVQVGTTEAASSGDALILILQQINEVTMQVNQIATAAEEQTATTSDISCNIGEITTVVQNTSKGAGVSAAAAARLSTSADALQQMVQRFKL